MSRSDRRHVFSGTPWEAQYGYARAVRVGDVVEVAGTTAVDAEGKIVAPGDAYQQTRYSLDKIGRALRELGADFTDVVRTRAFVTDIAIWQEVGRAHAETFGDVRPAATLVQVAALVHPDLLVEIEVTAHVRGSSAPHR
jgi:enamine deaminase RidA (YjgF/YER057c/UK114 family)